MTVGEIGDWLLDKGFAPAVVDAFAGKLAGRSYWKSGDSGKLNISFL